VIKERRKFPRLRIPLEAEYLVAGESDWREGTIWTLGAGGVALLSEQELEPGTILEGLHFVVEEEGDLPETRIEVGAEVVSVGREDDIGRPSNYTLGLRFSGLSEKECDILRKFVFQRLTRQESSSPFVEADPAENAAGMPLEIRFKRFDEFVDEVSENLSLSGMFIGAHKPLPPGSALAFRFQLGDDFPLFQGSAEVVWTRRRSEGEARPPGMGVRFLELDLTSQRMVERLVAERGDPAARQAGEEPVSPTPADTALKLSQESEPFAIEGKAETRVEAEPEEREAPAERAKSGESEAGLGRREKRLEKRLAEAEAARAEMQESFARLTDEAESLRGEIRALESSRKEAEKERVRAEAETAELRSELEGHPPIGELEEELRRSQEELEGLQEEFGRSQEELGRWQAEGESREEKFRAEVERRIASEAELQERLDRAGVTETELRERLEELEESRREMERRLAERDETENQLVRLRQEQEELRQEWEASEAELREQLQQKSTDEAELQELLARTVGVEAELRQGLGEARGERDALEHQLAQAEKVQTELRDRIADVDRTRLDMERERDKLLRRAVESGAERDALREQLNELSAERSDLRAKTLRATARMDKIRNAAEEVKSKLTSDLSAAREVETDFGAKLEEVAKVRASLEDKVESLTTAHARLGDRLTRITEAWSRLEDGLEEAVLETSEVDISSLESTPQSPVEEAEAPSPVADEKEDGAATAPDAEPVAVGDEEAVVEAAADTATGEPPGEEEATEPPGEAEAATSTGSTRLVDVARRAVARFGFAKRVTTDGNGDHPGTASDPQAGEETDIEAGAPADTGERETVEETVKAWAAAWSEQRIEDYLSFYAEEFEPTPAAEETDTGETPHAWLPPLDGMELTLGPISQKEVSPGRVAVQFEQSVESDAYTRRTGRTLEMIREADAWKIAAESFQELTR
jgi:uncharacterized protein (TIGR02266 family)